MRASGLFIIVACLGVQPAATQGSVPVSPVMSFFITSTGRGFGGNLGGLPGRTPSAASVRQPSDAEIDCGARI